jgi:hypothetical protein
MVKSLDDYQVDEDVLDIVRLMDRALETVVEVYAQSNAPLPSRRYWSMARPAEDCAQVVVSFIQSYVGAPGDQANTPQRCASVPRSAVLEITVTRDYPIGANGNPVTPANIIKASGLTAMDASLLLQSAGAFDRWGNMSGNFGVIATVTPRDPSGGLQTTVMNITVVIP